jgi:hypothetical protein
VVQTFDKSVTDRVRRKRKHDWDRSGDPLNVGSAQSVRRDYCVGSQANQFLRQRPEAIRIFVGKPMVKMDVSTFIITKIVERFHQNAQINIFFLGAARVPEHADNWNFIR